MDPESLYHELGHLAVNYPDLSDPSSVGRQERAWLGKAAVLIEVSGAMADYANFAVAANLIGQSMSRRHAAEIETIFFRALARAELAAPIGSKGAFIPVGGEFTAFAAIAKVLQPATANALFIDVYADGNLLIDYASAAPVGVAIRVLAGESNRVPVLPKPGLEPAARKWVNEFGANRPLEVRVAPARELHDRMIIIDDSEVYSLGQSFNAIATRSPTALRKEPPDVNEAKLNAFGQIWGNANPIV